MWIVLSNKMKFKCTSNFCFHQSSDASIAPVSTFLPNPVSFRTKSFHHPHSCLSLSHLFLSCALVYSTPVRFLNPIMMFSQLFLFRCCPGLLPPTSISSMHKLTKTHVLESSHCAFITACCLAFQLLPGEFIADILMTYIRLWL